MKPKDVKEQASQLAEFLAYLSGIETAICVLGGGLEGVSFLAYLSGIETVWNYHVLALMQLFLAYLSGIETFLRILIWL